MSGPASRADEVHSVFLVYKFYYDKKSHAGMGYDWEVGEQLQGRQGLAISQTRPTAGLKVIR